MKWFINSFLEVDTIDVEKLDKKLLKRLVDVGNLFDNETDAWRALSKIREALNGK